MAVLIGLTFAAAPAVGEDAQPETFQDCEQCPEMVVVPGGSFVMGSEEAVSERPMGPPHEVTIPRPFALGKYEITNGQYQGIRGRYRPRDVEGLPRQHRR